MTRAPIAQVCYVRLGSPMIDEAARFAGDILGLQRVATTDGEIAFRSDHLYQRICLTDGPAERQSIGLELLDDSFFEVAKAALVQGGFPFEEADADACKRRHVRQALLTHDGSGNAVDLVVRPAHSGRRYFPSRDAGVTGFQGVGLRSTNIARDVVFWTEVLNAQISDRVGDITYLRIDGRHHRIVLYPSKQKGILDVSFDVESFDCVMQSHYFLKERQVKILQGPGRETVSGQTFLRFQGPENMVFSYVHGMDDIDSSSRRARQYALGVNSLCSWGSECADVPELAISTI
jgi:2,3-dihydroxy-p-cumate/2,3-dihydroxybenzoate 3,4-dioxygenase